MPAVKKKPVVYLLVSSDKKSTYCGSTNDFARRLRQHNGALKGGARYTERRKGGRPWCPFVLVEGFDDLRDARQLEWRLKRVRGSRWRIKYRKGCSRMEARALQLARVFAMDKWTRKARSLTERRRPFTIKWADLRLMACAAWNAYVKHEKM